jgi:hypothetical protein
MCEHLCTHGAMETLASSTIMVDASGRHTAQEQLIDRVGLFVRVLSADITVIASTVD